MVVCVKRTNQIPNPMAYAIDMILCVNLSKYAGNETRGLKTNIPTFGKFQNLSVRRDLRVVLSKFAGNETRGIKTNIPTFGTFQNLSVRRDLCNHCLHTASLTRTISNVILGDPTFKETGSNKKTWNLPNVGIFDFHHPEIPLTIFHIQSRLDPLSRNWNMNTVVLMVYHCMSNIYSDFVRPCVFLRPIVKREKSKVSTFSFLVTTCQCSIFARRCVTVVSTWSEMSMLTKGGKVTPAVLDFIQTNRVVNWRR
jgi:hypothetical protein